MLLEIGQILGSYHEQFAVIGGAVPWLLLEDAEMPHVGTADVDPSLDAEALGDGEYAQLVEPLQRHDYRQRRSLRPFQLVRTVSARDGGPDIDVVVDFLMPREAEVVRNAAPLVSDFAVQRADGADLALRFYEVIHLEGTMPDGVGNRVRIVIASILSAWSWPVSLARHCNVRATMHCDSRTQVAGLCDTSVERVSSRRRSIRGEYSTAA